jgi:hypothetical protein
LCHMVGAFLARRLIWLHQAYPFKRKTLAFPSRCER